MKPRFATHVEVTLWLANGRAHRYAWTTPVPFGRCAGKGIKWGREELRKAKVPGRSNITQVEVIVRRTSIRF